MTFRRAYSNARWESEVGYCRALQAGQHIYVTGTAPIGESGEGVFAPGDARAQAQRCLELIEETANKTGIPAGSDAGSVVSALKHLGTGRIAVGSRWAGRFRISSRHRCKAV